MLRARPAAASIIAALLALFAATAAAAPAVVGYRLVSKTISSRTTIDYTYRVRVQNVGNPYSSLVLRASSSTPATAIRDGEVYLSFVDSAASVLTTDTFTIRQDRLQPFNRAAITWTIEGRELVPSTDPVAITAVSFVEFAGIPEHAGWLPIEGNPVSNPNDPGMLQLDLTAPLTSGRVDVLDANDAVLTSAPISPLTETDTIFTDYLASVLVPSQSFRLRLAGTDKQGRAVNKVWSEAFKPAAVNVRLESLDRSVVAGGSLTLPVRVTNFGSAQNFRLGINSPSTQLRLAPAQADVTLAAGESSLVEFTATIASGTPDFSIHDVQVDAVGLANPAVTNRLSVTLEVAPN